MADLPNANTGLTNTNGMIDQVSTYLGSSQQLVALAAQGDLVQNSPFQIQFEREGTAIENRVYLKVPPQYASASFGITRRLGGTDYGARGWDGIYFPTTPTIRQDARANWSPTQVTHTNYPIYSYQNSDPGAISVQGEFPVQNQSEALYWASTVHCLRSLTKMQTGLDATPGAPPPVCRFFAYGNYLYRDIPVVVQSFSINLPQDVDYFTVLGTNNYENIRVPALSSISMTLLPVYSRTEMANFSVATFVNSIGGDTMGYL
jgi:hypothetical protein